MQAVQNYLEKMGTNFLVSALIPSLTFVALLMVAFRPLIPAEWEQALKENFFDQSWLLLALLTVVFGFTLSSLNTFIYKLFEGYAFFRHFPILIHRQIKRARQLKARIKRLERQCDRRIERFSDELTQAEETSIELLKDQIFALRYELEIHFPPSEEYYMPTTFGNIMRAAESYSNKRYGMDSITTWTRMFYVIPEKYSELMERNNNELSFILNCALYSILFSFMCFLVTISQFMWVGITTAKGSITLSSFFGQLIRNSGQIEGAYLLGGCIGLAAAYIFHRASLFVVTDYGDHIRSAFDLFRSKLLLELNLELPKNSKEEIQLWGKISNFFLLGHPENDLTPFEYSYRLDKE